VPERAARGRKAILEVRVAVQRLPVDSRPSRHETAEQLGVGRRLDRIQHRSDVAGMTGGRKLPVVVEQRIVDHAEPAAGRTRVDVAARIDVPPEGDEATALTVRPWIDLVRRRDDRRSRPAPHGRPPRALERCRPDSGLAGTGCRSRHARRSATDGGGRGRATRRAAQPGRRCGCLGHVRRRVLRRPGFVRLRPSVRIR
jgi:hypothetical protein